MKTLKNTARSWLMDSGYEDIVETIDEIVLEWKISGNKQRRNWWDILAGDKKGYSRVIAGRRIPVLKAAQLRKGIPITENAISNGSDLPLVQIRVSTKTKLVDN